VDILRWFQWLVLSFAVGLAVKASADTCVVDRDPSSEWIAAQNERTWAQFGDGFWFDDYDRDERRMQRVSDALSSLPNVNYVDHYIYEFVNGASWSIFRRPVAGRGEAKKEVVIAEEDLPASHVVNRVECNSTQERCVALVSIGGQDATDVWLRQYGAWYRSDYWPSKASGVIDDDGNIWVVAATEESDQTQSGYPRSLIQIDVSGAVETRFQTSSHHVGIQVFELNGKVILQEWLTYSHARFWQVEDGKLYTVPLPSNAIISGFDGVRWYATLRGDWRGFNEGSLVSFRIEGAVATDIQSVFSPTATQTIDTARVAGRKVWLTVLDDVSSRLYVIETDTGHQRELFSHSVGVYLSLRYVDGLGAIVRREGFNVVPTEYEVHPGDGGYQMVRTGQAVEGYNSEGVVTEQYFATSEDGTQIPYFIVRHENDATPRPTVMWVYGGFSASQLPQYLRAAGTLWVEQGGNYVIANIRGGAEYGARWHRGSLRRNKPMAIADANAVADDLVRRELTTPSMLGIRGASNGGLVALAAAVLSPQRYAAVAASAPLTDMLRYPEFGVGMTWIEEYGDPRNPQDSAVLSKYSPLHNAGSEPGSTAYFLTVAANDDRVGPEHARRFASKLECLQLNFNYWEVPEGGHSGHSSYEDYLARQIMMYRFFEHWLTEE